MFCLKAGGTRRSGRRIQILMAALLLLAFSLSLSGCNRPDPVKLDRASTLVTKFKQGLNKSECTGRVGLNDVHWAYDERAPEDYRLDSDRTVVMGSRFPLDNEQRAMEALQKALVRAATHYGFCRDSAPALPPGER